MLWFSLFACSPSDACAPDLGAGELAATIDTAAFTSSEATWRFAGAALQLNAPGLAGDSFSIVLQTTDTGAALDEAEAPFSVDVGEAGGGWILYYPDEGGSLTTQSGSGSIEVTIFDDTLTACFVGVLGDGDGATVDLEGALVASGG
jgi:hypothetical protein